MWCWVDSFAFNLSPLKFEEQWDFLFYVCSDLRGGALRGRFALSITPSGAALRMMGGCDTPWKCRRSAEYQCFLTHMCLSVPVLRQPRLLVPGDCSLHGLGTGRSWLEHTGQRAAVAHSHCLDVKELGCPTLSSSFSASLSWSWGP